MFHTMEGSFQSNLGFPLIGQERQGASQWCDLEFYNISVSCNGKSIVTDHQAFVRFAKYEIHLLISSKTMK